MNPIKCKEYQQENKKLLKRIDQLEKINSIQALKMIEALDNFDRERTGHMLTLTTVEGMAEQCGTIGEFKRNWDKHLNGGLESIKYASREEQNAYLKKWGVEIAEEDI